jgi:hypothetical protein
MVLRSFVVLAFVDLSLISLANGWLLTFMLGLDFGLELISKTISAASVVLEQDPCY